MGKPNFNRLWSWFTTADTLSGGYLVKAIIGSIVLSLTVIAGQLYSYPLPFLILIGIFSFGGTVWCLNQVFWRREIEPRQARVEKQLEKLFTEQTKEQALPLIESALPSILDIDYYKRRLHASLSALRVNGEQIIHEVVALDDSDEFRLNVMAALWAMRGQEWVKALMRVCEAWDKTSEAGTLGASIGESMMSAIMSDKQTVDKGRLRAWLLQQLQILDAIMIQYPK